jgi:hypothetical protein
MAPEEIARQLGGKKKGNGWVAKCPAHNDDDPSLSIGRGDNGCAVVHCHAGCSQERVIAVLNEKNITLNGEERNKANGSGAGKQRIVATYDYVDEQGKLLFQSVRYVPKRFKQRQPDGSDWKWNLQGVRKVPYNLPAVIEAISTERIVCVVEGEKDVDNLAKLGITATCNSGGAKKWRDKHSAFLKGADVVVIPDNDLIGREHANIVAKSLAGIAARIRILQFPDLPEKGDASDWIAAGGTREQLDALVAAAPEWVPRSAQADGALPIIFGVPTGTEARECLIKGVLLATGTAILSGQFGMGKTAVAQDFCSAVITGSTFASLKVERTGAVLWFAAEGQHDLSPRLKALEKDKKLPVDRFARVESCPPLLQDGVQEILVATAKEAARQFLEQHDIPLRLIVFDTLAAAAGWTDENSSAECQRVMNLLATLAREAQCCVLAIDHLGKVADLGTRGNSAKEAAADAVLVILGDREPAGAVSNLQLAVRKTRCGPTGFKIPFSLRPVPLGEDESACVIDWHEARPNVAARHRTWPRGLRTFRDAITNALPTHGKSIRPWHDGAELMAVDIAHVRREFETLYAVTGETPTQRSDARRQAFRRNARDAQNKGLIGAAERDGVQWVWLAKEAAREPQHEANVTGVT